ncbi:MAG: hypothetical protein WBI07_02910 [Mobilitalea sp.]
MWRLMIYDSFHLNNASPASSFYLIYFSIYINFILNMTNSGYARILTVISLIMFVFQFLSPIRLAKGLYLCPLTEKERKNYLKMMCFSRFFLMEAVYAFLLIIIRRIYHVEVIKLIILFMCMAYVLLTILLLSGFYNPQVVKQQYYITNKLPVPNELKITKEKSRTPITGIYLLSIALVLSIIGTVLAFLDQSFDIRWLFYYIPALLISTICISFYFMRYFDIFITINANHEIYSYTRKKKVGAFHAD